MKKIHLFCMSLLLGYLIPNQTTFAQGTTCATTDPCNYVTIGLPTSITACAGTTYPATPTFGAATIVDFVWTDHTGSTIAAGSGAPGTTNLPVPATGSELYTLTVDAQDVRPNMICNPDFSAGVSSYTTSYNFLAAAATYIVFDYAIRADANTCFAVSSFPDHTGGGNMMVVNGGTNASRIVWQETITNICPNSKYNFSLWMANINNINTADLTIQIGGTSYSGLAVSGVLSWQQITLPDWQSGSSTSVTITICDAQIAPDGNDFAIDDIDFHKVSSQASASIIINSLPSPTITATYSGCSPACPTSCIPITLTGTSGAPVDISYDFSTYSSGPFTYIPPFSLTGGSRTFTFCPPTGFTGGIFEISGTMTGSNGCHADYLLDVLMSKPDATFAGIPRPCVGQPFTLFFLGTCGSTAHVMVLGVDYPVTFGSTSTCTAGSTVSASVTVPGISGPTTYCISYVEDGCSGCINDFTTGFGGGTRCMTVTPNPLPNLTIDPFFGPICAGSFFSITANCPTCTDYDFTNPSGVRTSYTSSTSSVRDYDNLPGSYTITGTDASGCTAETSIFIVTDPIPDATISCPGYVCQGTIPTVMITGLEGSRVYYNDGTLSGNHTMSSTGCATCTVTDPVPGLEPISTTTTYTITGAVSAAGCVSDATSSCTIEVYPMPNIVPVDFYITAPGWRIDNRSWDPSCLVTIEYHERIDNRLGTAPWGPTISVPLYSNINLVSSTTEGEIEITKIIDCHSCVWNVSIKLLLHCPGCTPRNSGNNSQITSDDSKFSLLPNPNRGQFNIKGTTKLSSPDISLSIMNTLGQTVFSSTLPVTNGLVDGNISLPEDLANGLYVLKIKDGDIGQNIKFTLDK